MQLTRNNGEKVKIILLITMASLFACGDKSSALEDGDINIGEALYTADCASCHGVDATGGSGPSIIGEDADEFFEVIREGEDDMPAFPDYTDQDIFDVIAYIDSL
jgi:mono/diheme cytochrome c family protein